MALIQRSRTRPAAERPRRRAPIALAAVVALLLAFAPSASAADPTFSRANLAADGSPLDVAVGDLNGDGRPDVLSANSTTNRVSVHLADGSGGFTGPAAMPIPNGPQALVLVDLDNDGKRDLAVPNGNSVAVLLGDGDGGFSPAIDYATPGEVPVAIAAGDFNNDGKRDVAL
ncbi:MAG TPA: VCBS repeat-containing protein, partial [Candidatus Limnocylindrales bacterium]|nr:VCBS repeat-containing protein [Candidatus Limnocylindrales bacterium]